MTGTMIAEALKQNQIPLAPDLPEKLEIYFHLLLDWNQRMDLVAIAPEEELLDRHLIDSLIVLKTGLLPAHPGPSLIDVGTGAGFPGMAIALARPDMQVTLLDSQQKRLNFLAEVQKQTRAENVYLIHARAEDGAGKPALRENFDLAVARAVAPLNVLCEYLLPYVRVGGKALCWKGPALEEELEAGKRAAFLLGGKAAQAVAVPIANRDWDHRILPVRKERHTPKNYPRKAGTPKQTPLGE